jgi:uncharacterized protein
MRYVFSLAILSLFALPASGNIQEGVEAYLFGDYATARQQWQASNDNPIAQFNLAMLYFQGLGVPREPQRAINLMRGAANGGYAPAQFFVGRWLLQNDSTGNPGDALFWLNAAAGQQHHHAAYLLGRWYGVDAGSAKDIERALVWLRKAETGGIIGAARLVDKLTASLPGVSRDSENAQIESRLKEGRGTAKQRRAFYKGQKAFINQDYASAIEIWVPLAEAGVAHAQYGIAFMLESGWGVLQDHREAAYWYKLAAQKGHRKAQFNLGKMYLDGTGVDENRGIGLFWIQSAADLGEPRARETMLGLQGSGS